MQLVCLQLLLATLLCCVHFAVDGLQIACHSCQQLEHLALHVVIVKGEISWILLTINEFGVTTKHVNIIIHYTEQR